MIDFKGKKTTGQLSLWKCLLLLRTMEISPKCSKLNVIQWYHRLLLHNKLLLKLQWNSSRMIIWKNKMRWKLFKLILRTNWRLCHASCVGCNLILQIVHKGKHKLIILLTTIWIKKWTFDKINHMTVLIVKWYALPS